MRPLDAMRFQSAAGCARTAGGAVAFVRMHGGSHQRDAQDATPNLARIGAKGLQAHRRLGRSVTIGAVPPSYPSYTVTPNVPAKPASVRPSLDPNSRSGQPGSAKGLFSGALVGRPSPLGATVDAGQGAVNFALYSSAATAVALCLFTENDLQQGRITERVVLDPSANKTGDIWHIALPSIKGGLLYGYQVSGEHQSFAEPEVDAAGHRFDDTQVVLDPYARAIISRRHYGQLGPNLQYGSPGVLGLMPTWPQAAGSVPPLQYSNVGGQDFDWEGDRPLNRPMEQLVIYEMHVRAFTKDASSGVQGPGTYRGMVQRLDYLQQLGVTAVELLPVQEFNELEYYTQIPGSDQYRFNFWGYSTVGFFAPMSRFSDAAAQGADGVAIQHEFKTLVKECHKRGIEVILDVVFNHTAEGNEKGPTLSFRGLDNRIYYMLAPGGEYYNYSGCGNTFNCNQPVVRQFILDCLKYWVQEYHVDGFRFDLASIMTRAHSAWHPPMVPCEIPEPPLTPPAGLDAYPAGTYPGNGGFQGAMPGAMGAFGLEGVEAEAPVCPPFGPFVDENGYMTDGAGQPTGTPLSDPPLIDAISEDPVLRNTKLIAEAWDCDGLNQVGAFPHYGGRWSEWNGYFRDTVRNFIKGSDGPWAGEFASAMCGSPNIYANTQAPDTDWWGNNGGRKWRGGRPPTASINFITAHDGFTLADLVSYNEKHNEANGENNMDGESHNNSWNCGEEGPTDQWDVKRLRQRQMRNLTAALLLSHGVPMITMGDEYGHTKHGNNNTYCHDSKLNWLDWDMARKDEDGLLRFTRSLLKIRAANKVLQRTQYVTDKDIQWHGEQPFKPDWTEQSRLVAFTLDDGAGNGLYVAFSTSHLSRVVSLPKWPGRVWQPLIDSSKVAPYDCLIADDVLTQQEVETARAAQAMWTAGHSYPLLPWSCVVLESVPEQTANLQRVKTNRARAF